MHPATMHDRYGPPYRCDPAVFLPVPNTGVDWLDRSLAHDLIATAGERCACVHTHRPVGERERAVCFYIGQARDKTGPCHRYVRRQEYTLAEPAFLFLHPQMTPARRREEFAELLTVLESSTVDVLVLPSERDLPPSVLDRKALLEAAAAHRVRIELVDSHRQLTRDPAVTVLDIVLEYLHATEEEHHA